jgi:hypothetical protein
MNFKIKTAFKNILPEVVSLKDDLNEIKLEIRLAVNAFREDFMKELRTFRDEVIASFDNIKDKEELELLESQNPAKNDVTITNTTIDSESVISTETNVYENIKGSELIINTRINVHENVSTTRQKKNKKNDDQSVLVEPTTHQYNLRSNNVFKNHTSTSIHIYEPKNKRHRL